MNLLALVFASLFYRIYGRRVQKLFEENAKSSAFAPHLRQEPKMNVDRSLEAALWALAQSSPAVRGSRRIEKETRLSSAATMASWRHLPRVAIVGRPNVGKSAIYNRLQRNFGDWQEEAVVHDMPGVTRDVNEAKCEILGFNYTLCDTGGIIFDDNKDDIFLKEIREAAVGEIEKACAVVFVVDGQAGVQSLDQEVGEFLRTTGKPVFVAVNKCESWKRGDAQALDFAELALGNCYPVSGMHGNGIYELMEEVVKVFPPQEAASEERKYDDHIVVALLGRPNAGKSSLLNKLTRTKRSIVSDVAGTTVDSIDQDVIVDNVRYTFVDTAGVRKQTKIKKRSNFDAAVEEQMVKRSLKAVRRADVAILLLDGPEGVNEQEQRLANFIEESGTGCVVVVNKWDLVPDKSDKLYKDSKKHIKSELSSVSWAKALFVSAETGLNTQRIFDTVRSACEQYRRRISTAVFNEALEDIVNFQKPPATKRGKQGHIYYGAQIAVEPPAMAIFCNDPKLFPPTYGRYLEKQIRNSFGFEGSPIKVYWKKKTARDVRRGK